MIIDNENVSLIAGTPIGIKLYKAAHEPAHYHDTCIEILFCVKGKAHIIIAYEEFDLNEGDIILVDSEDVHCISSQEDNFIVSFYIDQSVNFFGNASLINMSFVCHKGEIHPSMEPKVDYIHSLLLTMLYSYISPRCSKKDKIRIINKTAELVMETIENDFSVFYWMNDPNQFPEDAKARFEHIFTHIYDNPMDPMTIEELGKLEHINPNYLSQFLKKTSFMGLRGLRTYIRVYKAELMLLTTDLNITDISYQCGFSDPKYFYRAFKKWYGHTPSAHRKMHRAYMKKTVPNTIFSFEDKHSQLIEWIIYYQSALHLRLSGINPQ
ncbi:MAG: AraC family transcriptional regulator [Clostridiales bacterium]|nr:AraC family transcriptional regulator [Clostridiales bacterium]